MPLTALKSELKRLKKFTWHFGDPPPPECHVLFEWPLSSCLKNSWWGLRVSFFAHNKNVIFIRWQPILLRLFLFSYLVLVLHFVSMLMLCFWLIFLILFLSRCHPCMLSLCIFFFCCLSLFLSFSFSLSLPFSLSLSPSLSLSCSGHFTISHLLEWAWKKFDYGFKKM